MTLSQNSFNEHEEYVTPSEIIEFMYCSRFTYFMKCLNIRQYEENRYKVQKGREVHEDKTNQNASYVRKRIEGEVKLQNVYLISKKIGIKGIVDEIYKLKDGTYAPLDYKFAEYKDTDFLTYKMQMVLYSLLIEELYECEVKKMFLVYTRSKNRIETIDFDDKLREDVHEILKNYKKVISGYYPKATKYKARCVDCCYRNICEK